MNELGARLQALRRQANLSQQELAERLHVSRQSISKWELGTAKPDLDNMIRLSELFGVSMLFDTDNWVTWILPVFSLSLGNIVYYAMWLRRYMVDEANKDYIRLARAKGVPEGKISRVHIFRNAFVPLVQYIPNSILFTLMGSLYVESLYSIPGMGGLLVQVIKIQDNTMVQALVVIYAAISVVGLLLGDVLMALVDPRISFTKKEGSRA